MEKKFAFSYYYKYSLISAIAYCIPVFFFFLDETFSQLWLLYLGNMLFATALLISGIFVNRDKHNFTNLSSMVMPGLKVTMTSIAMICIIVIGFIITFNDSVIRHKPANSTGLYMILPSSIILINFFVGFFGIFLGSVTVKQKITENGTEIS